MSLPMTLTAITILKFFFICIWKNMKVMNDDLIARIVILATTFLSFSLYLVKFLGPGKPVLNTVSQKCVIRLGGAFIFNFYDEAHPNTYKLYSLILYVSDHLYWCVFAFI